MIRTPSRWGSQWKTAEIPCQHNIKEENGCFFLENHPETVLGNTFCAYLLQQFLSAGEDRHQPIISLGKVTELSFQRWWKIREKQWDRDPCSLSLTQKSTPAVEESRNLLRLLGGVLGRQALAAARGHALQLAGNGTDVGVSHHLGNRDAKKYSLENQLLSYFSPASFKPNPTLLNPR